MNSMLVFLRNKPDWS